MDRGISLLKENQYGFNKGKYYFTNLLQFFKKNFNRIADGDGPINAIFYGFQKALIMFCSKISWVNLAIKG